MGLGLGRVIKQGYCFVMKHSVPIHTPTSQRNRLVEMCHLPVNRLGALGEGRGGGDLEVASAYV